MQSFLLNGAKNVQNNELKAQEDKNYKSNDLKNAASADQKKRFARAMQDNLDKDKLQTRQRDEKRTLERLHAERKQAPAQVKSNQADKAETRSTKNESVASEKTSATSTADESKAKDQSANKVAFEEATTDKSTKKVASEEATADKTIQSDKQQGEQESDTLLDVAKGALDVSANEKGDETTEDINTTDDEALLSQEDALTEPTLEAESLDGQDPQLTLSASEGEHIADVDIDVDVLSEQETHAQLKQASQVLNRVESSNLTEQTSVVDTQDEEQVNSDEPLLSVGGMQNEQDSTLESTEGDSLLSQIQAAQQADTEVKKKESEPAESDAALLGAPSMVVLPDANDETVEEADLSIKLSVDKDSDVKSKLAAQLSATADSDAKVDAEKKGDVKLSAAMNVDNSAEQDVTLVDEKDVSSTIKTAEKSEAFADALKNQTTVPQHTVVDATGARPNQTSQIQMDKLVAFNQQAPAANNLLEAPLNLHSKQAASMMGERIMMMLSEGKQEVQIRLDPAELGSMLVKVQVQHDQVQLHIQTQAGQSKDILEQNMPRLREQLAMQGIQLSETNVQQQSQQQSQQQRSNQVHNGNSQLTGNDADLLPEQQSIFIPSPVQGQEKGIDYYA